MVKFAWASALAVAILTGVYLFGLLSWPTWLYFGMMMVAVHLTEKKRLLLRMLPSVVAICVGFFILFGWQSSPSVVTTGVVEGKYTWTSGTHGQHTRYQLELNFNGIERAVEVNKSTYDYIRTGYSVQVSYHMEKLVSGLVEHSVVESIGRGTVLYGGGMKFGSPGTHHIGAWYLIVCCSVSILALLSVGGSVGIRRFISKEQPKRATKQPKQMYEELTQEEALARWKARTEREEEERKKKEMLGK